MVDTPIVDHGSTRIAPHPHRARPHLKSVFPALRPKLVDLWSTPSLMNATAMLLGATGALMHADGSLTNAIGELVGANGALMDATGALRIANGAQLLSTGADVECMGRCWSASGMIFAR